MIAELNRHTLWVYEKCADDCDLDSKQLYFKLFAMALEQQQQQKSINFIYQSRHLIMTIQNNWRRVVILLNKECK